MPESVQPRKRSALDFLNGTTPGWDDTAIVTMDEIPGIEFKARIRVLQPVDILSESGFIELDLTSEAVAEAAAMQAFERQQKEEIKFTENLKDPVKFRGMLDVCILRGVVSIFDYDKTGKEHELAIVFDPDAKDHDPSTGTYSLSRFKRQHGGAIYFWLANKVMEVGGMAANSLEPFSGNSGNVGSAARPSRGKVRSAS